MNECWELLFDLLMAERARFPAIAAEFDLSPTQVHVLRWTRADGVEPLTSEPGVHAATSARGVVVVASAALDRAGRRHEVRSAGATRVLRSVAESPDRKSVV